MKKKKLQKHITIFSLQGVVHQKFHLSQHPK